jgi:hypothetical protein
LDRNTHRSAAACWISEKNLLPLVVLALLLVGVFFRLWKLGTIPGVNGDEAWLGWKAFEFARNGKLDWITNSGNLTSPFYILPLAALHKIFTPSVELLRSKHQPLRAPVLRELGVLVAKGILLKADTGGRGAHYVLKEIGAGDLGQENRGNFK